MKTLDELIDEGWAAADGDNPEPTIEYFARLRAEYGKEHDAVTLYEYASALDFAGREAEAAPQYEAAFAAGLEGARLRSAQIQYGSTLRNIERYDESVAILRKALSEHPDDADVKAFLALALTSAGKADEAVSLLLTLAVDHIEAPELQQYQRALRYYAQELIDKE